jgi:hypothetical protein
MDFSVNKWLVKHSKHDWKDMFNENSSRKHRNVMKLVAGIRNAVHVITNKVPAAQHVALVLMKALIGKTRIQGYNYTFALTIYWSAII